MWYIIATWIASYYLRYNLVIFSQIVTYIVFDGHEQYSHGIKFKKTFTKLTIYVKHIRKIYI